jgi:glyoxylase-like metal-dependent hydrolase (beta-lactamase superfamily II)
MSRHNAGVDNSLAADGATTPIIDDLGNDVFAIDTQMAGHAGITSSYLIRGSRPCLIETGTALSAPVVIAALAELGITRNDLATVVVTHIHLDHAGGVGDIAAAYPDAQVVVHEKGARHLADPTKLVASAQRVFGPDMDRLFGPLIATPAQRLTTLGEKGFVDLGDGRRLDTFHNPGHASHHVALVDSHTGDLYTGDAAGVFVPDTAEVRPATPPPDFDLDLALDSLARMRDARPTRLLFSHFGPVTDVELVFDQSEEELRVWVEQVSQAYHAHMDLEHAIAMVKEKDRERHPDFYADDERAAKFEELSSTAAQVSGIWRWLEKANEPSR